MPRSAIYEFAQKQFIITDRSADQLNDKETKKKTVCFAIILAARVGWRQVG